MRILAVRELRGIRISVHRGFQDSVASTLAPRPLIVAVRRIVAATDKNDDFINLGDNVQPTTMGRGLSQLTGERQKLCGLFSQVGRFWARSHATNGSQDRKPCKRSIGDRGTNTVTTLPG
jgi:hypothetical protein